MHLVLNKLGECDGCRFFVKGDDGRGIHDPSSPCGACERNPRLKEYLVDRKERITAEERRRPLGELAPIAGDIIARLDERTDPELDDWGLRRRGNRQPKRR